MFLVKLRRKYFLKTTHSSSLDYERIFKYLFRNYMSIIVILFQSSHQIVNSFYSFKRGFVVQNLKQLKKLICILLQ